MIKKRLNIYLTSLLFLIVAPFPLKDAKGQNICIPGPSNLPLSAIEKFWGGESGGFSFPENVELDYKTRASLEKIYPSEIWESTSDSLNSVYSKVDDKALHRDSFELTDNSIDNTITFYNFKKARAIECLKIIEYAKDNSLLIRLNDFTPLYAQIPLIRINPEHLEFSEVPPKSSNSEKGWLQVETKENDNDKVIIGMTCYGCIHQRILDLMEYYYTILGLLRGAGINYVEVNLTNEPEKILVDDFDNYLFDPNDITFRIETTALLITNQKESGTSHPKILIRIPLRVWGCGGIDKKRVQQIKKTLSSILAKAKKENLKVIVKKMPPVAAQLAITLSNQHIRD